jgi:hypothetical protein
MIFNDDSGVINKVTPQFGASLTYDTRVIIDDHNMFIIEAIGVKNKSNLIRKFLFQNIYNYSFYNFVQTKIVKRNVKNGKLEMRLGYRNVNHNYIKIQKLQKML